jgi:hypothetical protein
MLRAGLLLLFTLACAAQKPQQKAATVAYASKGQPKPKGVMRCQMEEETGSNRMERVCTYDDGPSGPTDGSANDGMLELEKRAAQHVNPPSP